MQSVKQEILDKVELNMVVKGTVTRITDFGAFIDIGGIDALLPLSQISRSWIDTPNDILTCGEKIDVEIIGIDKEKQRISLSLKSLQESPWLKAQEILEIKKKIKGKVTRIKPFGAFIEVYPQVEGLLNKGQVQQFQNKTKQELKENDEIDVIINRFDAEAEKINLEIVYE
jgi:ribosomal protein S1